MPSFFREYRSRYQPNPYPDEYRAAQISQIQSYLGRIETTVDDPPPALSTALRQSCLDLADKFDAHTPTGHLNSTAESLRSCSQVYALYQIDGDLAVRPYRCRSRACPVCSEIRASKWYFRSDAVMKKMTACKHITLTVASSDLDLIDQIKHLVSSFRRLRQRNFWKTRTPWGYWTLEITQNAVTKQWHPHLHVVCNASFMPFHELRYAWAESSMGSTHVYIKAVSSKLSGYLAKYVAKTSTLFQADLDPVELFSILKGRRFVQPFGKFPPIPEPDAPDVHFIGLLSDVIRQSSPFPAWKEAIAEWILENHPAELQSSLRCRPPRSAEFAPCLARSLAT